MESHWLKFNEKWTRITIAGGKSYNPERLNPLYRRLVLIIPGNPGIDQFYSHFASEMVDRLADSDTAVCSVSHLNHITLPAELHCSTHQPNERTELHQQIEHKLLFIREYVPKEISMFLVGHSIGAYMCMKLLNELEADGYDVQKVFLLFPTIERMRQSPNGRKFSILFSSAFLMATVYWLLSLLDVIPQWAKRLLLRRNLNCTNLHPDTESAGLALLRAGPVRNVIFMAAQELHIVDELEEELVRDDRFDFYYGVNDRWAPLDYALQMRDRLGDARVSICDCEHAFVISDSVAMAEKIAHAIRAL